MADYTVQAGELRTIIVFQEPTVAQGSDGAQTPVWANITHDPIVRARWINAHGNEMLNSGIVKSIQRATVTVRYRGDILATWRILNVDDSTYWQILSVDQVQGRKRWTEMVVERTKGTL